MADIVPTQANVIRGTVFQALLGEAVASVGQILYFDASEGKYKLAQNDSTQAESIAIAMALATGAIDASIDAVQIGAEIDLGAVVTAGLDYAVSATAGGIAPFTDLISTNYVSFLGLGLSTSKFLFQAINSRVQKP